MGERSPEEIRQEIETERERLGGAVGTLHARAHSLARRLTFVALGAAGLKLVVTAAPRLFRRRG